MPLFLRSLHVLFAHLALCMTGALSQAQCPFEMALAPNGATSDQLGWAVAVSGDTAVIGAVWGPGSTVNEGAAYVFTRSAAGVWSLQAQLNADDAADAPFDFGRCVAIDGDVIVVGAKSVAAAGSGSVYVFQRSRGTWSKVGKLEPDPLLAWVSADFGKSVAIDGDTIAVGAWLDQQVLNAVTVAQCGAVYVFTKSGKSWGSAISSVKLGASDGAFGDHLGTSVAVDGERIVAGADGVGTAVGAAYVFERGTAWVSTTAHSARLAASDAANSDIFGTSVDVSSDSIIVGASLDDHAAGTDKGSAYVFVKSAGVWSQQQKIVSNNTQVSAGEFGVAVAIEGEVAVVAERLVQHLHPTLLAVVKGSAHVFGRTGTVWTHRYELLPADYSPLSVTNQVRAMDFDGSTIVLGSPDHNSTAPTAGAAFMFSGVEADCNANGVPDSCDIQSGSSLDADGDRVPDECTTPTSGDVNGDGSVNVTDLLAVISAWGACLPLPTPCPADVTGDGSVNVSDLLLVIGNWG